ncbi:sarcosine oxidase subunit gamma family protein [Pelagibius sp. CAU 1746]|uniref:sarcosine oxidase subunit gamma n=1 Tax=Pelagibius sp. CAU 1746 TaxID=3140370 RepID=UPI00325BBEAE
MASTAVPESPLFGMAVEEAAAATSGGQARATLRSLPFYGKFLLKGRIEDAAFASAIERATGMQPPSGRAVMARPLQADGGGTGASTGDLLLFRSSPKCWMLISPPAAREGMAAGLRTSFALAAEPHAVRGGWVDMSAGLHLLSLEGDQAAALLERGCPLDLDDADFPPGAAARSLFGPYAIALVRRTAGYWLLIDRSYARSFVDYLLDLGAPFAIRYAERGETA